MGRRLGERGADAHHRGRISLAVRTRVADGAMLVEIPRLCRCFELAPTAGRGHGPAGVVRPAAERLDRYEAGRRIAPVVEIPGRNPIGVVAPLTVAVVIAFRGEPVERPPAEHGAPDVPVPVRGPFFVGI